MPALTAPNLSLQYGWTPRSGSTPGDSGWGNPVSANFKKIDALLGLSVLSATATAPVVTTDGTRYIVPTGGTGAFAGKDNQVAVRVAGVWEFYVPARGWLAEIASSGTIIKFDGAAWLDVLIAIPPDGVNLLPDTYSWGSTTLPVYTAATQTVVAQAVAAALSGYGIKITTGSVSSGLFTMFSPNNTTGRNMMLDPGDYIVSAWISSPTVGHKVALALWDGTAKLGPDITLSATRTRYSALFTVTTTGLHSAYMTTNRSGVSGVDIIVDSVMVSRRMAPGSSITPPAFTPGASSARVTALAAATSLNVNVPSSTLINGAAFTKIGLTTVIEDTIAGWNAGAFTYTPLESGMYLVQAMLRPVRVGTDNMPSGTNLKLGFGSAAADGIDVVCDSSADALPITVNFCKPMRLVAGSAYFMFGNHTAAAPIAFTYAQLKITKIGS